MPGLQLVKSDLLPADQERENLIDELAKIVADIYKRPLHERRAAWNQMQDLIGKRPEYVIKKMELEQNLVR